MLHSYLPKLKNCQIFLASGSPRRLEILKMTGLVFQVLPSNFDENLCMHDFPSAAEFVKHSAECKALDVLEMLKKKNQPCDLVIGADTVVMLDKEMFGKPKSKETAIDMLKKLSGKTHKVHTGVALVYSDKASSNKGCDSSPTIQCFDAETEVHMDLLPYNVIEAYVDTGEPLDKAGGYGIQGSGGSLIESINGDFYNVMGFPLHKFCKTMSNLCSKGVFVS